MHFISFFGLLAILVPVTIATTNPVTSSTSSDLSDAEKMDLIMFRGLVGGYLPSYLKYKDAKHSDRFLLRFLVAHNFNLTEANDSLRKYFEWRKTENVDDILEGGYKDNMDERQPYILRRLPVPSTPYNETILDINLGKWKIADVAASTEEEKNRFIKYATVEMMEHANRKSLLHMDPSLAKPARFRIFLNLKDYSWDMNGCSRCITLQLNLFKEVMVHWSEAVEGIYFLNAPGFSQYANGNTTELASGSRIPMHVRVEDEGAILIKTDSGVVTCVSHCGDSVSGTHNLTLDVDESAITTEEKCREYHYGQCKLDEVIP